MGLGLLGWPAASARRWEALVMPRDWGSANAFPGRSPVTARGARVALRAAGLELRCTPRQLQQWVVRENQKRQAVRRRGP
eukprot:11079550-Lingulodinium_polyedra.AAC.1